jgi:hypothetical protein
LRKPPEPKRQNPHNFDPPEFTTDYPDGTDQGGWQAENFGNATCRLEDRKAIAVSSGTIFFIRVHSCIPWGKKLLGFWFLNSLAFGSLDV